MQKQIIMVLAIAVSLISCSSIVSDERQGIVQQKLTDKLHRESKGVLTLESFTKTNGTEQEQFGVKMYKMEFKAVITPTSFCIVPGNPFQGYLHTFHVVLKEPTDGWGKNELLNAKRVQAGQKIQLTGTATLVQRENGWESDDIEIKSYSF
jgi:hypothetical protein